MSKKFTETTKWADPWFRSLTAKQKCLWLWLCDNCDCAGVVPEIDWGLVSFQIGEECDERDIEAFRDRLEPCGSRFWIRKYVAFQWGYISEEKPSAPHRGVIKALARVGITLAKAMERVPKPLPKPYERLKDKDKDKDKEQGLVKTEDRVQGKETVKKPRPRNPLFDALASIETANPERLNDSEAGKIAKALSLIRQSSPDVTPEEIKRRAANYATHYPTITQTALGLAKNWSVAEKEKPEDQGKPKPREMYGNDYFARRDELEAQKERDFQARLAREKAAHEAALAGAAEVCADLLADDPNQ